jgi:hypothetical protein
VRFTEETAVAMITSLRGVEAQVRGLAAHAGDAHDTLAGALLDYRTGYAQTTQRLRGLGARRAAQLEAQRAMLARVEALTDEVQSTLAEAEGLADRTRLLAFNARLEAAREVLDARSFTIVAQEMHALSEESARRAGTVRERLTALTDALHKDLRTRVALDGEAAREEGALIHALDGSLDRLVAIERELAESQRSAQRAAQSRAEEGSAALRAAVGGVQFQDIVRQSLSRVVDALDALDRHDAEVARAVDQGAAPSTFDLAHLGEGNTLQSQHRDHAAAMGHEAPPEGPPIELF